MESLIISVKGKVSLVTSCLYQTPHIDIKFDADPETTKQTGFFGGIKGRKS